MVLNLAWPKPVSIQMQHLGILLLTYQGSWKIINKIITICPIHQRMEFKLVCLVHQSMAGQTRTYLASDIQLSADTGHPQLRSASERICAVPRTLNSFNDRSFSAAGLCV